MTWKLLAPELFLTAGGMLILLGETVWRRAGKLWVLAASFALILAVVAVMKSPLGAVGSMAVIDGMSQFLKAMMIFGVLLVLGLSLESRELNEREIPWGAFTALVLFSTVGLMLLVSATDLLMSVVALELVSISSFVLVGFLKNDKRGGEAAIKYFMVGAFSAGLMLYGISLYYALFGTTAFSALAGADLATVPKLPLAGAVFFLLAGFGFKVAMAPFHMWVPDVYEGASLPVTAFISVAPKAAGLGALMRALPDLSALGVAPAVAVLAALTMTVGNVGALKQTNIKRLLGYSSIAQMGYVLMGVVVGGKAGVTGVLLYIAIYTFMNLGAFACAQAAVNDAKSESLDAFNGLARRSFPLALGTAAFLISLTGLPPMAGFVGKFSLFAAAMEKGWVWLAVAGALNSVISLYYYFGILRRMFFDEASRTSPVPLAGPMMGCVVLPLLVTLWAGVFPERFLVWVRSVLP